MYDTNEQYGNEYPNNNQYPEDSPNPVLYPSRPLRPDCDGDIYFRFEISGETRGPDNVMAILTRIENLASALEHRNRG